ncbi:putative nuclease HARBI1 [Ornithodoros turicata]|uniref:putative nuclease HARBI1 n=1 Tax=Ornithodoros turicata TaxID=34597 RepID=UPI00313A0F86
MAAYVAAVEIESRRTLRRERVLRPRTTLQSIPENHLLRYYRLPRSSITSLCEKLAPALQRPTARCRAIPVDEQVLVALRFYASGSFQSVVGDVVAISQSSASRIVNSVTTAIVEMATTQIKFPRTPADVQKTVLGFLDIAGFPKVLGCIDCTHVLVKPPKREMRPAYRNRKGLYSINVQAVCNADCEITQLTARWPGCTHDSFIWSLCNLHDEFQAGRMPEGWLLGDSGYPTQPWLLTPFQTPSGEAEEKYNKAHRKTRQVIERAFGLLKSRFRCLDKSGGCLLYPMTTCCSIIVACGVLHNYCIRHNILLTDPVELEEAERPIPGAQDMPAGISVRDHVVTQIFTEHRPIAQPEIRRE